MKKALFLLLTAITLNTFSQKWEKTQPNVLYAVDKNQSFSTVKVGIRTDNPTAALDVNGRSRTRGNAFFDSLAQALSVKAGNAEFETAVVTGQLTAGSLVVNGISTFNGQITSNNIAAQNITANTVNATQFLSGGNPLVSSQWTTNSFGGIRFNGDVEVRNLLVNQTISIGQFLFSNGSNQQSSNIVDSISTPNAIALTSGANSINLAADEVNVGSFVAFSATGDLIVPPAPPAANGLLFVSGNIRASESISSKAVTVNSLNAVNINASGTITAGGMNVSGQTQFDSLRIAQKIKIGNSIILDATTNPIAPPNSVYTDNGDFFIQSSNFNNFNTIINANNDGKVGIGTSTPLSKLDVNGDFRVSNNASGPGNIVVIKAEPSADPNNSNAAEAKVGIGTENPVRALHILTTHFPELPPPPPPCPPDVECDIIIPAQGSHNGMRLEDLTTVGSAVPVRTIWDIAPIGGKLVFAKGDPNGSHDFFAKMAILDNGNVGIGTTSPTEKFDVSNNVRIRGLSGSTNNRFVVADQNGILSAPSNTGLFWEALGNAGTNPATNFLGTTDVQDFVFRTNNVERMRITGIPNAGGHDGLVGIGTSAPQKALHIATFHINGIQSHQGIRLENHVNDVGDPLQNGTSIWDLEPVLENPPVGVGPVESIFTVGPPGSPVMTMRSNGNVGIGITPPDNAKLFVNGNTLLNGNVGIGTNPDPNFKLAVCGIIHSKEVIIEATNWCDYVFEKNYKRMSWQEKLAYINANKHLPAMSSGKEIETKGLKTGATMQGMMQNIEENTLDVIDLYQIIKKQNEAIVELKKEIELLKKKK